MTIRFAAAHHRNRIRKVISVSRRGRPVPLSANDNGHEAANDDAVLSEALRHFAAHGVCAARHAGDRALLAHRSGDAKEFDWWLSVCRMLDRRLANAVSIKASLAT